VGSYVIVDLPEHHRVTTRSGASANAQMGKRDVNTIMCADVSVRLGSDWADGIRRTLVSRKNPIDGEDES
jgi:hypothetical protein